MSTQPVAILSTGLVTSVGLTAPAACAAIRAKLSNPSRTRYMDSTGEWIMAHQVPLEEPWRGRTKLIWMAVKVVEECLGALPREEWSRIPLVLCVAEPGRPGRMAGLDEELLADITTELDATFAQGSCVIAGGRTSVISALALARNAIWNHNAPGVLIVATDSLVTWPTLRGYDNAQRLLGDDNSNGFLPGEGAGALLVGARSERAQFVCTGLGEALESATIETEEPLRGDGISAAIRRALQEAGHELQDLNFRVTDLSGEHYYFKEAALAIGRLLRVRLDDFDIWHPAECIGEAGAVAGLAAIVVADAACRKAYAPGPRVLCHLSADAGARAAAIFEYGGR